MPSSIRLVITERAGHFDVEPITNSVGFGRPLKLSRDVHGMRQTTFCPCGEMVPRRNECLMHSWPEAFP
jgi:hypothetical protein